MTLEDMKERRFQGASSARLEQLIEEHWNTLGRLFEILYELQFRQHFPRARKAEVLLRVLEVAGQSTNVPGFEYPTTDVWETRRRNGGAAFDHDWREVGLLKLSGYSVGATADVTARKRRLILNTLFLRDRLEDVQDREYAAEWGSPGSSERLEKIANSIATFARNAKRNSPQRLSAAIEHWESDLDYLKKTFYDRWGNFPWPSVEVY